MKDWKGNSRSALTTLGAHTFSTHERQHEDFYATSPLAAKLLLEQEELQNVWECAVGKGHLAEVFDKAGVLSRASDIIDRCNGRYEVKDFLSIDNQKWDGDIVTNPPFRYALEFIQKGLSIVPDGRKVCMFLRLQFLEGKTRRELYRRFPPKTIYVSSSRIACAMNADFEHTKASCVCYMWAVWEKGYKGSTTLKWIN